MVCPRKEMAMLCDYFRFFSLIIVLFFGCYIELDAFLHPPSSRCRAVLSRTDLTDAVLCDILTVTIRNVHRQCPLHACTYMYALGRRFGQHESLHPSLYFLSLPLIIQNNTSKYEHCHSSSISCSLMQGSSSGAISLVDLY